MHGQVSARTGGGRLGLSGGSRRLPGVAPVGRPDADPSGHHADLVETGEVGQMRRPCRLAVACTYAGAGHRRNRVGVATGVDCRVDAVDRHCMCRCAPEGRGDGLVGDDSRSDDGQYRLRWLVEEGREEAQAVDDRLSGYGPLFEAGGDPGDCFYP